MPEYLNKLSGALPKGTSNGFADDVLAEELWSAKIEGRNVQPRAAVIIYDVAEAKVNKDGDHVVTCRILRIQPVSSLTNRRALEKVLISEYREQTGAHLLPYDVESVAKQAFIDLPKTDEEIDAIEADEQDHMSPTDELRRHLERVHGIAEAGTFTPEEADSRHTADHDGDMPDVLQHDREWLGWTRADLEATEAEADDDGGDNPHPSGTGEEYSDPAPLRDDVLDDEHEAAAGGPDPDYGRDLDNEGDTLFSHAER